MALPAILGKNDHGHLDTKSTSKTDRGAHFAGAQGYMCKGSLLYLSTGIPPAYSSGKKNKKQQCTTNHVALKN